ncbi:MAG: hypothetical protein KGI80_04400 [Verrucomicrobiota bacterium]|nr:hypothetical protein [Verrucomicrobiota bacterium]
MPGLILLFLFSVSCSRFEQSEQEKMRRLNRTEESLPRRSFATNYLLESPLHTPRTSYPWEAQLHLPKITKEFFRCKGNCTNPPLPTSEEKEPLRDCHGTHGLPILHGKEGVYPLLIDLLNYVQKKTGRRVIITCGHRCPLHNSYADASSENRTSKHQIGAEVDFYVQGMEDQPLEIAGLIMQFFQETPPYAEHPERFAFQPYEGSRSTRIKPWINKELFLKIVSPDEGRDGDNRHPYPYLCCQVRFDSLAKEPVVYTWEKAHRGYAQIN